MIQSSIDNYFKNFKTGVQNLKQKNHYKALQHFNKSLEYYHVGYGSMLNIGHIQLLSKNYAKAEQKYTECVHYRPYLSIAYKSRFFVYLHKKQYQKALSDANAAISCQLMKKYIESGDINQLNQAISIAPNNLQALTYRKLYYFATQKNQLAEKDQQLINCLSKHFQQSNFKQYETIQYIPSQAPFFSIIGAKFGLGINEQKNIEYLKQRLQYLQKIMSNQPRNKQYFECNKQNNNPKDMFKTQQYQPIQIKVPMMKRSLMLAQVEFSQKQSRSKSRSISRTNQHAFYSPKFTRKPNSPRMSCFINKQAKKELHSENNDKNSQKQNQLGFVTLPNEFNFRRSTHTHCISCKKDSNSCKDHCSIKPKQYTQNIVVAISIQELNIPQTAKKLYRYCNLYTQDKIYQTGIDYTKDRLPSWNPAFNVDWDFKTINTKLAKIQVWQCENQTAKSQLIGVSKYVQLKFGRVKCELKLKSKYIGYLHITIIKDKEDKRLKEINNHQKIKQSNMIC